MWYGVNCYKTSVKLLVSLLALGIYFCQPSYRNIDNFGFENKHSIIPEIYYNLYIYRTRSSCGTKNKWPKYQENQYRKLDIWC